MVTHSISDGHAISGLITWKGQPDYSVIPEWLNAASGSESCARVMNLIDEIRQVESGTVKAMREGWYVSTTSRPQPKAIRDELSELDRKHARINAMLESYHFSPAFTRVLFAGNWMLSMFSAPVEGEYVFHRVLHEENKRLADGARLVKSHMEHHIGEADVVFRILNLAAESELERVQQCRNCWKWVYAERASQKFCSDECRLETYSKSSKYKNYRKQYMRRYRADLAARQSAELAKRRGR